MTNLPKIENLTKITEIINEEGLEGMNIEIKMHIPSKTLLNKINEEFFYRDGLTCDNEKIEDVDNIIININNVTFNLTI